MTKEPEGVHVFKPCLKRGHGRRATNERPVNSTKMKTQRHLFLWALMAGGAAVSPSSATIKIEISGAGGGPPATLGGYGMTGFPVDARPGGFTTVSSIPLPGPGPGLVFSSPVEHVKVGTDIIPPWHNDGGDYTGDAYSTGGLALSEILPSGTLALYQYFSSNDLGPFHATVSAVSVQSGSTIFGFDFDSSQEASFIGVSSDDPSDPLVSISISVDPAAPDGFAVGEFGINPAPVPDTGSAAVEFGSLGLLGWFAWRKQTQPKMTQG